ncbi:TPA: protein kinase, partial [Listeria innocua]|nr:protein kinase [Listeria innocua]
MIDNNMKSLQEKSILNLEKMKDGLIEYSTGGEFDETEYVKIRYFILNNDNTKKIAPDFLRTRRTLKEFWQFIKNQYSSYAERREFLTTTFNIMIDTLEQTSEFVESESFDLSNWIGGGGFGEVFKIEHQYVEMSFALKVLNPIFPDKNKDYVTRFFREAKILFSLNHPNIIKIYDTGIDNGKPFIKMEYIDGYDLDGYVKKYSTLDFTKSKVPIQMILKGLAYAHNRGVIHRDLKPSNILVSSNGTCKIIDFGISAYLEPYLHTKLTLTNERIVGGSFIDPLLMDNPSLRDKRSDIYSIGAIWYYLIVGSAPIGSDIERRLVSSNNISKLQANVILKCLSHSLEERFQSCEEILNTISPKKEDLLNISNNWITDVTHLDLIDFLKSYHQTAFYIREDDFPFNYYGRYGELEFLNDLYELDSIEGKNGMSFIQEIEQHRINNYDWEDTWFLTDDRLKLKDNDENLLKFLSYMFHPKVRNENSAWEYILENINDILIKDGYKLVPNGEISGKI